MPDNEADDIDAILAGKKRPQPRNGVPAKVPAGTLAGAPASDPLDDEDLANVRKLAAAAEAQKLAQDREAQSNRTYRDKAVGDEPGWMQFGDSVREAAKAPSTFVENAATQYLGNTADEIQSGLVGLFSGDDKEEIPREYAAGSRFEDNRRTLLHEKEERDAESPNAATGGRLYGGAMQGLTVPGAAITAPLLTAADYMGQGSGSLNERAGQAWDMAREHPFLTATSALLPAAMAGVGKYAGKVAPILTTRALNNRANAIVSPAEQAAIIRAEGAVQGPEAIRDIARTAEEMDLHKGGGMLPTSEHYAKKALEKMGEAQEGMAKNENALVTAHNDPLLATEPLAKELDEAGESVSKLSDMDVDKQAGYYRQQAEALRNSQTEVPGTPGPKPTAPWELPPAEGPWTPGREPTYAPADPADLKAFESLLEPTAPTAPVKPSPLELPTEPLSPWFEGPWTAEQPGVRPTAAQKGAHTKLTNKATKAGEPLPVPLEERATVPPQGPGPEPPEGHVLQHKQAIKEQQGQYKKESAAQERQYKQELKEHKTGQKEYEALKKKYDAAQAKGPPKGKMIDKGEAPRGPDSPPTQEELDAFYAAQKAHFNPDPVKSGKAHFSNVLASRRLMDEHLNYSPAGGVENAGMKDAIRLMTANKLRGVLAKDLQAAADRGEVPKELVGEWLKDMKLYGDAASVYKPALKLMSKRASGDGLAMKDLVAMGVAQSMGLPGPAIGAGAVTLRKALQNPSFRANRLHNLAGMAEGTAKHGTVAGTAVAESARPSPTPSAEEQKAKNQTLTDKLKEFGGQSWDWLKDFLPGS